MNPKQFLQELLADSKPFRPFAEITDYGSLRVILADCSYREVTVCPQYTLYYANHQFDGDGKPLVVGGELHGVSQFCHELSLDIKDFCAATNAITMALRGFKAGAQFRDALAH